VHFLITLGLLILAVPASLLPEATQRRFGLRDLPVGFGTAVSGALQAVIAVALGVYLYELHTASLGAAQDYIAAEVSNQQNGVLMGAGASHFLGFLFFTPAGLACLYLFVEGVLRGMLSLATGTPVGMLVLWIIERVVMRGRDKPVLAPRAEPVAPITADDVSEYSAETIGTTAAVFLAVFASMLPARLRRHPRVEHLPLAVGCMIAGFFQMVWCATSMLQGGDGNSIMWLFFFAAEGFLRMSLAFTTGTPVASLPVWIACQVTRFSRRSRSVRATVISTDGATRRRAD
jgi:hypothetical protein